MRQLILQDRHVTYRKIETLVGPAYTQYFMNIGLSKKFVHVGYHTICQSSKKARVDWSKEMLQKYDRDASKHVYGIEKVDESWIYAYEPESKQQSTV